MGSCVNGWVTLGTPLGEGEREASSVLNVVEVFET